MYNNNQKVIFPKNNDFDSRFLDFAKRYDALKRTDLLSSATIWVKASNYEYIRHFLKCDCYEFLLPFSLKEFACMQMDEIDFWHDYCIELQHLLDEKKSLYKELLSYYK